jgi:DNA-binding MarR family transcriptional regulator
MNKIGPAAETGVIDAIVTDLFRTFRLQYKKLIKADFSEVSPGLSSLHFLVLRGLDESGALPISEIGKKLLVPRPQMTHLTDQLITMGLVIRVPDMQDRRVIRIEMTGRGKTLLAKCRRMLRENMKRKLSYLSSEELDELSGLLGSLSTILSGLE